MEKICARNIESKNVNLDFLRIFAAFMVLLVHITLFGVGRYGVQLFFVLSGYLNFASLSKNGSIKTFYKKRMQRIFPTYYVCLALLYLEDVALTLYLSPGTNIFKGQCGFRFLRYVFFIQCFTPTDNWDLWNNHSALWTMSSFVGFYIAAPFLYKILNRFYKSFLVTIFLLWANPLFISGINRLFSHYPEDAHIEWFATMNPLTVLYCFMLGATLFMAVKEGKEGRYAIFIGIVLIMTSFGTYPYELLFTLLILVAVVSMPLINNSKMQKYISYVSKGTFALYLIHPLVLKVARGILKRIGIQNVILSEIYLFSLCIIVSYAIYYLIIYKIEQYCYQKGFRHPLE